MMLSVGRGPIAMTSSHITEVLVLSVPLPLVYATLCTNEFLATYLNTTAPEHFGHVVFLFTGNVHFIRFIV